MMDWRSICVFLLLRYPGDLVVFLLVHRIRSGRARIPALLVGSFSRN